MNNDFLTEGLVAAATIIVGDCRAFERQHIAINWLQKRSFQRD